MGHKKIRKFNTSHMYPGKSMNNDLCMAVKAGNRIFLRGQTCFDLDGNITGIGDATTQTENAMSCVKTLLEESGSKLEHICKVTVYITEREYREDVYAVIGRWLKGIHVCSTGLIVKGLAIPEMLMEIDVEAVIPEDE